MNVAKIHEDFTIASDILWGNFQRNELTHREYRAKIESAENAYRESLKSARQEND